MKIFPALPKWKDGKLKTRVVKSSDDKGFVSLLNNLYDTPLIKCGVVT